jgi:hypothetical protein
MYEIWDGDLFLFSVDDHEEADSYSKQGFQVVALVSS